MTPEHRELGCSIYVPFRPEHYIVSYSLHLVQFVGLCVNYHLLQIEASQMRFE